MSDFDYVAAWHELAYPAFQLLPEEATDQILLIAEHRSAFTQDSDCDVTLNAEDRASQGIRIPGLLAWFDKRAADAACPLARWARTAFFAAHWRPGAKEANDLINLMSQTGAGWIFSKLADQAIQRRLGLPKKRPWGTAGFEVIEGMLRFGVGYDSAGGGWTWKEAAWAARDSLDRCRAIQAAVCPGNPPRKGSPHQETYDYLNHFEAATKRMHRDVGLADPTCAPWLTVVEDYDRAPEVVLTRRCNVEAPVGWRVLERQAINLRPHAFTIRSAHLGNSNSMMLDPDVAPCAHPGGCDLRYTQHKHDTVLVVQAGPDAAQDSDTPDVSVTEPVRAWLKHICDLATEAKLPVDGIVIVRE